MPEISRCPGHGRPLPLPAAAVLATVAAGSSCAPLVPGSGAGSLRLGWMGRARPEPPSGRGGG